jgi:ribonuclease HI
MPGVPREVIEHHLAVCPQAHPVKQKTRKQAQVKQDFIVQEIVKLKKAKLIREVAHPTWIANPVVVPKANGSGRLCVDFTSLNKACPKDPYPLPRIDQIIDSTAGYDLLCFLDAFSGYHQIKMAREDKEKTAFITPCDVYCYVCMPFGLKNARATFQRLMRKALGAQMGRNVEAYLDDIIVKTRKSHTFIEDLEETFANLRKVNIKLNPAKCAFGVPSGKLLGFLVSHRGIEANPDKFKAIEEMRPPRNLKEMQRLAGCMAALGHFIARSGEKALPFFKLMKRTGKFECTPKTDKAFAKLKRYLTSPPIMVAPMFREPLLHYMAATPRTASAILVAERDAKVIAKEGIDPPCPGAPHEVEAAVPFVPQEEPLAATSPTEPLSQSDAPELQEEKTPEDTAKVQKPVYFVSTVLRDTRERYTMQQKMLYTLLITSRKQGHPIKVVTDRPLETILRNPNVTGRVAECAVELQPFEISFETTKVIKGKALAEFTAEWTDPFADEPPEVESTLSGEEAPGLWVMHFDGAFNLPGAGAGAILTSPSGDKLFYAVQLCFKPEHKVSNNIAEYEGLLAGLRAVNALGIKRLIVKGDSQLVVNFSNKSYTPKDEHMAAYLEDHRKMEKHFQGLELKHIPRGENVEADEIMKHASHRLAQPAGVFEDHLFKPSASPALTGSDPLPAMPPPPEQGAPGCGPPSGDRVLLALARQEGVDWILKLKAFLISSRLPEDASEAKRIVHQASGYCIKDGDLYRHPPNGVALKCISTHQGQELLRDIHAGECGHHASASTLTAKAYRSGFYWPSALGDTAEMVKRCEACQFHAKQIHQPAQELQTIPLTWPFAVWCLDILGPFPRA